MRCCQAYGGRYDVRYGLHFGLDSQILLQCISCVLINKLFSLSSTFPLLSQGDTKLVLKDLVAKSLLQVVGERYRLHDLVLFSAKAQLRSIDRSEVRSVTLRQAQYLGRLDIVRLYYHAEGSQQGLYALSALWRSILQLSDDKQLQVDTYNQSLGELGDATAGVAGTYRIVASLFSVQVGPGFADCPNFIWLSHAF